MLPVIAGLLLVSVLFQSLNANFLTAGNLVNLLVQGAVFMLLAMGEVFALLLGEIDLSIGFVAGLSGIVMAELVKPTRSAGPGGRRSSPRWSSARRSALLQGTLITRLGLPSFVVTLAGLLGLAGRHAADAGQGGSILIQDNDASTTSSSGNLTPHGGWVVMLVIVGVVRA